MIGFCTSSLIVVNGRNNTTIQCIVKAKDDKDQLTELSTSLFCCTLRYNKWRHVM